MHDNTFPTAGLCPSRLEMQARGARDARVYAEFASQQASHTRARARASGEEDWRMEGESMRENEVSGMDDDGDVSYKHITRTSYESSSHCI